MKLLDHFRLNVGETVTLHRRKAGGWSMRFCRREKASGWWMRLLPEGRRRMVQHPR